MTTEQKAAAYDKALERANTIYTGKYKPEIAAFCKQSLEDIFPELKESGDEKIRKALIEFVKQSSDILAEKNQKSMLTWLEKQDKKELDPRKDILEELLYADDIYQMSVSDDMVEEAKQKAITALSKMEISKLLEIEKQGNQKDIKDSQPTDFNSTDPHFGKPIEQEAPDKPKFKIDDWIVRDGITRRITKIGEDGYLDDLMSLHSFESEKMIHLWTIQDAKDGDVLYVSTDIRSIHALFQKYENGMVYFHCYFCGNFSEGGYEPIGGIENISPLPQYHKERFFQRMAEAGYEWDAERKLLRKFHTSS